MAQRGYHGVSVPRVVERAGVSQGTFYRYFENLDQALGAVVQQAAAPIAKLAWETQIPQIDTAAELETALLRYYRELASLLMGDANLYRELIVVVPATPGPAGDAARSFLRGMRHYAREALASVNGRPPFRAMDPQIVGSAIVGMVVGAAQEIAELGPAFAPEVWAMEMAKLETCALLSAEARV